MNNKEIFLSREGLKKLKEEIKYLEKVKREEIKEDIKTALDFGDVSENSEYDIAKESYRMNEIKIIRLKQKLSKAKVVEENAFLKGIGIGTTLKLKNIDSGKQIEYSFVPEDQINFAQNKISLNSPLGQAFLGHNEGEDVEIKVPVGILKYKILKIIKNEN